MANVTEHRRHLTVPIPPPHSRFHRPPATSALAPPLSHLDLPSPFGTALDKLVSAAQSRCQHFERRVTRLQDILDHDFEAWRDALHDHESLNDELQRLSDIISQTSTQDIPQTLAKIGNASRETYSVSTQLEGMGRRIAETESRLSEGGKKMERLERVLTIQEAGRGWLTWTNIVIGIGALVLALALGIGIFYIVTMPPPLVPSLALQGQAGSAILQ